MGSELNSDPIFLVQRGPSDRDLASAGIAPLLFVVSNVVHRYFPKAASWVCALYYQKQGRGTLAQWYGLPLHHALPGHQQALHPAHQ